MAEALEHKPLRYTGLVQPQPGQQDKDEPPLYPYLPSDELVEVVNLAISLKRPLLLNGEPGCGKTKLARAVAYELKLPYEEWNIKSTSRAKDGLYTYDVVGRLRDAQLAAVSSITEEERNEIKKRFNEPRHYVKFGPLGKALENKEKQTVVLIDEIDKADIDFPNDLLLELDELRFDIEETGDKIRAKFPPIVFITSNDEKDLSDAFLRRCLFYYMEFPQKTELIKIIKARFPNSPQELDTIIDYFVELRDRMRKDKQKIGKTVSTSELIDWVQAFINDENQNDLVSRLREKLLYPSVLLKNWDDYQVYKDVVYKKLMSSAGDS